MRRIPQSSGNTMKDKLERMDELKDGNEHCETLQFRFDKASVLLTSQQLVYLYKTNIKPYQPKFWHTWDR